MMPKPTVKLSIIEVPTSVPARVRGWAGRPVPGYSARAFLPQLKEDQLQPLAYAKADRAYDDIRPGNS